jgi:hypothetical protein
MVEELYFYEFENYRWLEVFYWLKKGKERQRREEQRRKSKVFFRRLISSAPPYSPPMITYLLPGYTS